MPTTSVIQDALDLVRYHRPDIHHVISQLPIRMGQTPPGAGASYEACYPKHIMVSHKRDWDIDTLAAILVHEGTHALDDKLGTLPRYVHQATGWHHEVRAFRAQTQFWQKLYPYGKLPERTELDHIHNRQLDAMRDGTLDQTVSYNYELNNRLGYLPSRHTNWPRRHAVCSTLEYMDRESMTT